MKTILPVLQVGRIAQERLAAQADPGAAVMGVTSRGVFLRLADGGVVFLSSEAYGGPLTLNLGAGAGRLAGLEARAVGRVSMGEIEFPGSAVVLRIANNVGVWEAPDRPGLVLPVGAWAGRWRAVARQALALRPVGQAGGLLPAALAVSGPAAPGQAARLEGAPGPHLAWEGRLAGLQAACQAAWRARQPLALGEALGAFMGLGPGLTPSGDDLIAGFLLALARWGDLICPGLALDDLARPLLARASGAASALSAGLLACAARGQADERLILGLDGLLVGAPDAPVCAAALAGWGHTSGLDALVGMGIALGV